MRSLLVLSLLLASTALAFKPEKGRPVPAPKPAEPQQRLQTGRIDFETMNLTGNTLAPNTVQVRDRKLLHGKSMVKTPDNFRQALYDER
jgi:hypothetical protein